MAKSRKPRKKSTNFKKVSRILKGACMHWSVEDPLKPKTQIVDTKITHKNPYYRLMCQQIARDIHNAIDRYSLKYRVNIECEFKDQFGKQYFRGAEVIISGVLKNADGYYQSAIEDVFAESNMNHYVITHVTAEILGAGEIKEKDFAA